MAHFTPEDWKAFAEGLVKGDKRSEMEQHMLTCDVCIDKYLSCFSRESTESAAGGLHPQFTSKVMKRISGLEVQRRGGRQGQWSILYYAAAACLTLFFVSAGVFESFVGIIPEITKERLGIQNRFPDDNQSIIQFGWSDKLMNNTLTFIDSIKPKGEEVSD